MKLKTLLLLVTLFATTVWPQVITTTQNDPAKSTTQVLVKFKSGPQPLPGSRIIHGFRDKSLFLVSNQTGLSSEQTATRYRNNPSVVYAEPDYKVSVLNTPSDPMFSQQWDMNNISAPQAWDSQTNSSDTEVAIIDTGIDFTHPDLQGNLDAANSFTCINGSCVSGGQDDFGHGTHVAGTIGAVANNGIGIAGLNWQIKLIALKFLNSNGSGQISDAILAFDKVLELKQAGVNIRVTNNSWGGGGFSQALKDAMLAVEAAGIVNVCAAGNSAQNADIAPMYPGAFDNRGIISVLASDSSDLGAYFTNFGLANVDIAAPGVSTLSTVPTGSCTLCDPSGYKLLSGTSMATPHVSGVMAALLHLYPALTAAEARDIVLDPASYDVMSDSVSSFTSTGGRLNFYKTIHNPKLASLPFVLNNFPIITTGPDVTANAGDTVTLTASASDPDGDPVRLASGRLSTADLISGAWLMGAKLSEALPLINSIPASFIAPPFTRTITEPYGVSAADNRGGGVQGTQNVTILSTTLGTGPSGTISVSPTSGPVGTSPAVTLNYTDPDNSSSFDLGWTGPGGSQSCCFQNLNGSPISLWTFNTVGSYRISATLIDRELRTTPRMTTVIHIGGDTNTPPLLNWTSTALSGPVPFTVTFDLSGSQAFGTSIIGYSIGCLDGTMTQISLAVFSCTFTVPGTRSLQLAVLDGHNWLDVDRAYVVTTPSSTSIPPPTTQFTLTLSTAGTGSGTVTANPSGPTYAVGTSVSITETPANGSTFSGWSGACTTGTGTCNVTMNSNLSVTATFTANPPSCTPRGKSGKCK